MWPPFHSIEPWAPNGRIIYDKFHVLQPANKAIDEVRLRKSCRSQQKQQGGGDTAGVRHPSARKRRILRERGGIMLQQVNQTEARDLEWSCQAVSPMDEPCDASATYHCGICGRWFCALHAEDEAWHHCALEPGDVGGEA
jgi:hypothetical protein